MIKSLKISVLFIFVIYLVFILDQFLIFINFNQYGIMPRYGPGMIGIITAPFLHADVTHILSNTVPLFVLLNFLIFFYQKIALRVIGLIVLLSGFLVWLLARPAIHIGASGLIYGIAAFLFASGWLRRSLKSIIIAIIIFFLYSGLVYGLFPVNSRMSFEAHLFGAVAGIFCAVLYKKEEN